MEKMPIPEGSLVIVWNAESGWQQALLDSLHKWVSPQTYRCDLCRLTHGAFGPKREWKVFLESLGRPVVFLHRDQWQAEAHARELPGLQLPAILESTPGGFSVVLDQSALAGIESLPVLLETLQRVLSPKAG